MSDLITSLLLHREVIKNTIITERKILDVSSVKCTYHSWFHFDLLIFLSNATFDAGPKYNGGDCRSQLMIPQMMPRMKIDVRD